MILMLTFLMFLKASLFPPSSFLDILIKLYSKLNIFYNFSFFSLLILVFLMFFSFSFLFFYIKCFFSFFYFLLFLNFIALLTFISPILSLSCFVFFFSFCVFLFSFFMNLFFHLDFNISEVVELKMSILILALLMECFSQFARPLSLGLRLKANLFIGSVLKVLISSLPLSFFPLIFFNMYEFLVCVIQSFVFIMLSSLYLEEVLECLKN